MIRTSALLCLVPALAIFLSGPTPARAQAPIIPTPKKASLFLDPVEMLLRSVPASAIRKLSGAATTPEALNEINRYFADHVTNKSIVLHTTVEAAEPHPDVRNAFRMRATSTPLAWDGGSMKRLSWLYFQKANAPEANAVKVGSEITVVGWVRRCEVVMTPEGLRLNFDLQHSHIEDASQHLPEQG